MLDSVLWDNDGVLIDTASLFHDANKEALLTEEILMDESLFVRVSQKQGKSILEYYAQKKSLSPADLKKLLSIRQEIYVEKLKHGAIFNLKAFNCIELLKKKKIKNFLVTGSNKKELSLEYATRSRLLDLFDGIITSDDYKHPKPHAEPFLCVLAKWQVSAENSVVVDDLPRGLIAAHRAGLKAIRYNPFKAKSKYRDFAKFYQALTRGING